MRARRLPSPVRIVSSSLSSLESKWEMVRPRGPCFARLNGSGFSVVLFVFVFALGPVSLGSVLLPLSMLFELL